LGFHRLVKPGTLVTVALAPKLRQRVLILKPSGDVMRAVGI
jgi:hypothetical protein